MKMLNTDRLIYTVLDIYHSIIEYRNSATGKIKKIIVNHRYKKKQKKLLDIIDQLPLSNIILTTNSIIEFVSYLLYTSEVTSYRSIRNIIIKSNSNTRNIYLLNISEGNYQYNIKLDLDNTTMDIDIKQFNKHESLSANTKLSKLQANDSNKNSFVYKAIEYLNYILLEDISEYIREYISKGD